MKILVTGSYGQLGRSLQDVFSKDPELEVVYTDYDSLDITDRNAVSAFLKENRFDIVVNCAAYTAVDRAETDEILCSKLNTEAVGHLGEAASKRAQR